DRLRAAILPHRGRIANPGIRRLREDRGRIADIAEVDAADIDRLQQRRPELEIDPLNVDAERLEGVFDRMTLPYRRKETAFLRADADRLRQFRSLRRQRQ